MVPSAGKLAFLNGDSATGWEVLVTVFARLFGVLD
jgi:hypothetical protein